jgi:NAD(P)-dependent dehydrogenase (short-subunit alcohol dehydrogenase family)
MFTFELSRRVPVDRVTANCLHPATFMSTKMGPELVGRPWSSVAEGAAATLRLMTASALDGVTGECQRTGGPLVIAEGAEL